MKKISLLLTSLLLIISVGFSAKPNYKKKLQTHKKVIKVYEKKKQIFSRECCEKGAYDSNGTLVTIEVCCGWFLSNSDAAHDRACEKALAALSAIVPNP